MLVLFADDREFLQFVITQKMIEQFLIPSVCENRSRIMRLFFVKLLVENMCQVSKRTDFVETPKQRPISI